jgi:hypothetical protein
MKFPLEPIAGSLQLTWQGNYGEGSAEYTSVYYPSANIYGPSIHVRQTDDHTDILESLDVVGRQHQSVSLFLHGGVECSIVADDTLFSRFLCISRRIESINVESPYTKRAEVESPGIDLLLRQQQSIDALKLIFAATKLSCVELRITRYIIDRHLSVPFIELFDGFHKLVYLSLTDMGCSDDVFGMVLDGLTTRVPSVRYLDASQNNMSTDAARGLYDFISLHKRLVYVDIGYTDMTLDAYNLVLDACEYNEQIQVLVVEHTCAASEPAKNILYNRLTTGSLELLDVVFDGRERIKVFRRRISSFLKRNATRRLAMEHIDKHSVPSGLLPTALFRVNQGKYGFQNLYYILRNNNDDVLKQILAN